MLYFILDLLALGCINAILVVGLNLQYGYAGILNFTYYTFVAIGAYVAAVTTMGKPSASLGSQQYILQWSLPWPIGLLLAGLVAAVAGLLLLLLTIRRLRSDYLAIVTVSVGFIIWNFITNYIPLFDGSNGLFGIPYILNGAKVDSQTYTLEMLGLSGAILAMFVWVSRQIYRSPYGRVLRAIREDEVVAESFGKSVRTAQISVFMIGCFMAGIGGGLLVYYLSAWSPASFLPEESFILMAALIVGGTGNYWGAIVGAALIVEALNELSRFLPSLGNPALGGAIRAIVIGVVLIAFLRYRPEGILPERRLRWYRGRGAATAEEAQAPR
jgi:branched-chain amino acid transport system permease protein